MIGSSRNLVGDKGHTQRGTQNVSFKTEI